MGPIKDEFCQILKKINALEFGTFKLPNGRITPYYIDLKLIPSFPDAFHKICNMSIKFIEERLGAESFDRVASIPTAGMAFASVISYHFNKPFLYIRQRVKVAGRERKVEGILMPGDKVLLIDDLVTTGLSLTKAAAIVRAEGGVVEDAFVLLDRGEGGRERLTKEGIRLHYLVTMREVAERLYEVNAITEEQMRTIMSQIKREE